jgi:hypothetical protein
MPNLPFQQDGTPLSSAGLTSACQAAGVEGPELWSVLSVETSGCGYLADRRPKILFERHVFHRLTGGKFDADDPDVSNAVPGGYGLPGAHQYDRLAAAIRFDRDAALRSASWGLGQTMGENFVNAGFTSIDDMANAMVLGEDNQLRAMGAFIAASGMTASLVAHQWTQFARAYNGPDFAAHNYDGLLEQAYQRCASGGMPSLQVRRVQMMLRYNGSFVGNADGELGSKTEAAIRQFQASRGLATTGQIGDQLIQALQTPGS